MSERLTELDVARLEAVRDSLGRRAAESDNRDAAASLRDMAQSVDKTLRLLTEG
jgi:hypothetical protein